MVTYILGKKEKRKREEKEKKKKERETYWRTLTIKHSAHILFGPFEPNKTLSILRKNILFQYTNVRPANGSGGRATFQMTSPLFPRTIS